MTPAELVRGLATAIRREIAPRLGTGREVTGRSESGDASFALDEVAEQAAAEYLAAADLPVALFTEDRGLVGAVDAPLLLVVDPIDGTRPARCGLESCCVSVAVAPNRPAARLGDVSHAAVYELKTDRLFTASRGGGVRIEHDGRPVEPALSSRTSAAGAALSIELAGRPAVPTATVLGELIDGSSIRGGVFAFASTTFALTRLITGQLEAHVDVADRIRRERPELTPRFVEAGAGGIVSLFVYDIAAVLLIAEEAGVTVTDAFGASLDAMRLTDVSDGAHASLVAACTPALHRELLESIERGLSRLDC